MKIKKEHFEYMKSKIEENVDGYGYQFYKRRIVKEGKAKDLAKRARWDLSHAYIGSMWICENLYSYCDDNHIDTALRRIVSDLGFEGNNWEIE